jgi:hypothetical protein
MCIKGVLSSSFLPTVIVSRDSAVTLNSELSGLLMKELSTNGIEACCLIKHRVMMSRVSRVIKNCKSQPCDISIIVGQRMRGTLPSKKQTDDTATRSDKNANKSDSILLIALDSPLKVSSSVSVGTVINRPFAIVRELDKEEEAKKENSGRGNRMREEDQVTQLY